MTFPARRDPSVIPSGKVDVVNNYITFNALPLPKDDIRSGALNATLSGDNTTLIVSYRFDVSDQSQICCAPLDKFGLPETFVKLKDFGTKSAIYGLGCSSTKSGHGYISYGLRKARIGTNSCINSLYCVPFRQKGKDIDCSSESVLLAEEIEQHSLWESFRICNHCWLDNQKGFVFERRKDESDEFELTQVNVEDFSKAQFRHMRITGRREKLFEDDKLVAVKVLGNVVRSNLLLQNGTVNFLEAPMGVVNQKIGDIIDSYRTIPGLLVSLDIEGNVKSEERFPVISHYRKTLITKTHCFFPSIGGGFFLTAALETPQDYFELRFSKDELQLPDSGICYVFDPLLILPSGRHLLCARDVGRSFVDKAQKLGLPLSTLGIIELPFKVG